MAARWSKFVSSFTNLENESDSDFNVRKSLSEPQSTDPIAPKKLFVTPLSKVSLKSPTASRSAAKNVLTPTRTPRTPARTPSKTATPLKPDSITQRYYRHFKGRRDSPGVHKIRKRRPSGHDATPRGLWHSPRSASSSRISTFKARHTPTVKRRFEVVHPEFWLDAQKMHLTAWINSALAPEHPSKSTPIGSYEESTVLANRIRAMHNIFKSDKVQTANSRLNDLIATSQIFISDDIRLRTHIEHQDFLVQLLLVNYNPNWLYPALCVFFRINFGSQIDAALQSANVEDGHNADKVIMQTLEDILRERLLNPDIIELKGDSASTPRASRTRQGSPEDKYNGAVLSSTFALVLLLDVAKQEHFKVIETDPPLFRTDSKMESSEDVIRAFGERFLRSEGDVIRHLSLKSFHLSFQAPLAERITDLSVRDIFADMKDGIRLCKLASIITKDSKMMDSVQMVKNGTDREMYVTSLRNVNMALQHVLHFVHNDMKENHQWFAKSQDVVKGYERDREKILGLMWKFSDIWVRSIVLDKKLLTSEVTLMELKFKKKNTAGQKPSDGSEWYSDQFNPTANLTVFLMNVSEEAKQLLSWAALVCAHYKVKVREFTESFRDGLPLCCLIHYYRPDVLSIDSAVAVSSVGAADEAFAAQETRIVEQNFELFTSAAIELGGIPHVPVSIRAATARALTPGKDEAFGRLMYLLTAYVFKRMVTEMRASMDKENISSLLASNIDPVVVLEQPSESTPRSKKPRIDESAEKIGRAFAVTPKFRTLSPRKLMSDISLSMSKASSKQVVSHSQDLGDKTADVASAQSESLPAASSVVSGEEDIVVLQAAIRKYQSRQKVLTEAARQAGAARKIQRDWRAYSFRKRTEAGFLKNRTLAASRTTLFKWNSITRDIVQNTRRIFAQLESRMRAANHVALEMRRIELESAALNLQRAFRRTSANKAFFSLKESELKKESKGNAIAAAGLAVAGMAAALTAAQAYGKRVGGILELAENAFNIEVKQRFASQMQTETMRIAALIAFEKRRAEQIQTDRAAVQADSNEMRALEMSLLQWEDTQAEYLDHASREDDDHISLDDNVPSEVHTSAMIDEEAERVRTLSHQEFENRMRECNKFLQRGADEEEKRRRYEELLAKKQTSLEEDQKVLDKESEDAVHKARVIHDARKAAEEGLQRMIEWKSAILDVQRACRRTSANKTFFSLRESKLKRESKGNAIAAAGFAVAGMAAALTSAQAHGNRVAGILELAENAFNAEVKQRFAAQMDTETRKIAARTAFEQQETELSRTDSAAVQADISELRALELSLPEWKDIETECVDQASNDDVFSAVHMSAMLDDEAERLRSLAYQAFENCMRECNEFLQRGADEEEKRRRYEKLLSREQTSLEQDQKSLDKESEDAFYKAGVIHDARKATEEGLQRMIEWKAAVLNVQRACRRTSVTKAFFSLRESELKRESRGNAIAAAELAAAGMAAALSAAQAYGKRVAGVLELAENSFNAEVKERLAARIETETRKIASRTAFDQLEAQQTLADRAAFQADGNKMRALEMSLRQWEDTQAEYLANPSMEDDDHSSPDDNVHSEACMAAMIDAEAERLRTLSHQEFENSMRECNELLQRGAIDEEKRRRYEELLSEQLTSLEEDQKVLNKEDTEEYLAEGDSKSRQVAVQESEDVADILSTNVSAEDAQLLIDLASTVEAQAEAEKTAVGVTAVTFARTQSCSSLSTRCEHSDVHSTTSHGLPVDYAQLSESHIPGDNCFEDSTSTTAENGSESNYCTSFSTATSQIHVPDVNEADEGVAVSKKRRSSRERSISEHTRELVAASVSVVETNQKICATSVDTMSIFNEMGELLPAGVRDAAEKEDIDDALDAAKLAEWQAKFASSLQTPDAKVLQAHIEQCEAAEENKEELSAGYGSIFDGEPSLSEDLESIARDFEMTKITPSMGKEAITASQIPSTIRRLSLMASSSNMMYSPTAAMRLRKKEDTRTVDAMRMGLLIVRGCSKRRGESRFVEKAMLLLSKLCSQLHGCRLLMSIADSFDVLVTCAQFYRDTFSVLNPCVSLLMTLGEVESHRVMMAKRSASVRILGKLARFLSTREAQIVRTNKKLESANKLLEELIRRGIPVAEDPNPPRKEAVFSEEIRACWKKLVSFNRVFNIETRA